MRIHCLENVDKALQFLKEQRVHLENMGSHDIVDGNHRLTLGLIWTIILRFQVRMHTLHAYLYTVEFSILVCNQFYLAFYDWSIPKLFNLIGDKGAWHLMWHVPELRGESVTSWSPVAISGS